MVLARVIWGDAGVYWMMEIQMGKNIENTTETRHCRGLPGA